MRAVAGICMVLFGFFNATLAASDTADEAWATLEKINPYTSASDEARSAAEEKYGRYTVASQIWWEGFLRNYRTLGTEFWQRYPQDSRRFQWLLATVDMAPQYWRDTAQAERALMEKRPDTILIDNRARADWEERYIIYRSQYMSSTDRTEKERSELRGVELTSRVADAQARKRRGESVDLLQLGTDILELSYQNGEYPRGLVTPLHWLVDAASSDPVTEKALLSAMIYSPRAELRLAASGRLQVAQMRGVPIDLTFKTLDGKQIDLKDLRGKVVLVDIWSNSCASCILAMPEVQKVYDKYRDKGFEVVGIWLSGEVSGDPTREDNEATRQMRARERPTALGHLKRQGATWPNAVLTGAERKAFSDKYAVVVLPATWLFDQNGLLITTEIHPIEHRLDAEVRRLLEIRSGS